MLSPEHPAIKTHLLKPWLTLAALTISSVLLALFWQLSETAQDPALNTLIFEKLRLPRATTAFSCGLLLGLSGINMQVMLRNPLADPYILGIAGGASVAVLIGMLLGFSSQYQVAHALTGALGATLLITIWFQKQSADSRLKLLLAGVVFAAGWNAILMLLLSLSPDRHLRSMTFWLLGDFSFGKQPVPVIVFAITSLLIMIKLSQSLNLLSLGELKAKSLGLNVSLYSRLLHFFTALMTAVVVSIAGPVGFVGLVIPHACRLIIGSEHRRLIPFTAIAAGTYLLLADTIGQFLLAPRQIPAGVITALMGVPVFLFLLLRQER